MATVVAPQYSVPPQPSGMVPLAAPAAAQVVGVHVPHSAEVPPPHGKPYTATAVLLPVASTLPSSPYASSPQHFTVPSREHRAGVLERRARRRSRADTPVTTTGAVRCRVVPSPSWPLALSPQHSRRRPP